MHITIAVIYVRSALVRNDVLKIYNHVSDPITARYATEAYKVPVNQEIKPLICL